MLTRKKLLEKIKHLPESFSLDQVINQLFIIEKIEKGVLQSHKEEITPDEELDKKLPELLF